MGSIESKGQEIQSKAEKLAAANKEIEAIKQKYGLSDADFKNAEVTPAVLSENAKQEANTIIGRPGRRSNKTGPTLRETFEREDKYFNRN